MKQAVESPRRIAKITLDERTVVRRNPEVEHERAVAIYDLIEDNLFDPVDAPDGPYHVKLSIEDNRLVFDIRDAAGEAIRRLPLAVTPFRRIVKDYFQICESYFDAIKWAPPSRIEAIDMGRRGVHNEGAQMLKDRLAGNVEINEDTARRLFTLLCVLHIRG